MTDFVHPSIQHLYRVSVLSYLLHKLPSQIEAEENKAVEALEIVIGAIKREEHRRQKQNG